MLDASVARTLAAPPPAPIEDDDGMPPGGDDHGLPDGCKREEPKRCTNIGVEIDLGSLDWRQFHTSVIKPLVDKGANTKISVSLSATHADGFDRDFIELSIREGATQINRNARIETDTG